MRTYVQKGMVLSHTASGADIDSDEVVVLANGVGVATGDIADGESGELIVEGVVTGAKATGEAWTLLQKLYYDATADKFTTTATSNKPAGVAAAPAASADTTGKIKLIPGLEPPAA
jgi:predicted RecA/RadA family phage recombinase